MGLTRPKFVQINTQDSRLQDPITVVHSGASLANVDVGFLLNRNNGVKSNVALYWSESGETIKFAYTDSTGDTIANINVLSLANITAETAIVTSIKTDNFLYANGDPYSAPAAPFTSKFVATDFSTANAQIAGGSINGSAIGNTTASTGRFTTLVSTGVTISAGNLVANSGTTSTSTTTGAMVVAGGTGISGNVNIGGLLQVNDTTNAIPYVMGSGAFHVAGGMSIAKDFWIGGNLYVANVISQTTSTLSVSNPLVYLEAANPDPYNFDIGVYSHFIESSIYGHTGLVRSYQNNYWGFFSNVTAEPSITGLVDWSDPGIVWERLKAGSLILANSTASTSTSTGALIVAGGAGIAGNAYVDKLYTTNGVYWSGNSQQVAPTLFTTITASGNIVAASGTTATGANTGALVVTGGAGVSGNLYVSNISVGSGNIQFSQKPGMISGATAYLSLLGDPAGVAGISALELAGYTSVAGGTQARLDFVSKVSNVFYNTSRISSANGPSSTAAGQLVFSTRSDGGSLTERLRIKDDGPIVTAANIVAVGSATSNTTTGAIVVVGGVGVSGGIITGGNIVAASGTDSVSTTTGAAVVVGGVGVSGNVTASKVYTGSGIFWSANGISVVSTATAGTSPPSSPVTGAVWYNTATDVIYEYLSDGTSSYWIDISSQIIAANTSNVISGNLSVTYQPTSATGAAIQLTGKDTRGGIGWFDFLQATNTTSGATNPNKFIRLNSTGGIEIINSAYTTTILSLSDAGAMSVSGSYQVNGKQAVNGPAFRAYIAGAQTITSGSQQKVTFGTETFDTNGNFASSRFTPNLEGYYQLNATVRIDGTASTGEVMIILYKNGSEYARGTNEQGTEQGVNFYSMQVSDIAYANGTTDNFEIYIQQTSGGNRNTTAGSAISYFSGCMIRGA